MSVIPWKVHYFSKETGEWSKPEDEIAYELYQVLHKSGYEETFHKANEECHLCRLVTPDETATPESPDHYKTGGIETIDYMRAKMTPEQFEGYCLGNVIKYVSRYRDKNGVEDLRKCSVYLNWLIETVEKK